MALFKRKKTKDQPDTNKSEQQKQTPAPPLEQSPNDKHGSEQKQATGSQHSTHGSPDPQGNTAEQSQDKGSRGGAQTTATLGSPDPNGNAPSASSHSPKTVGSDPNDPNGKSSGMIATEKAVNFLNKTVLDSKVTGMQGTSKSLADQAAAMMLQDMRAFVQGNEQLITVGMGKAIALMVDPATTEKGKAAAKALTEVMNDLSQFATKIGKSATTVMQEFDTAK